MRRKLLEDIIKTNLEVKTGNRRKQIQNFTQFDTYKHFIHNLTGTLNFFYQFLI